MDNDKNNLSLFSANRWQKIENKPCLLLLIAAFEAAIVFYLDLKIPLGVAFGVSYVIVIFTIFLSQNKNAVIFAAVMCSVLTLIGYFESPSGGEVWQVYFNRGLSILVIWATAAMSLFVLHTRNTLKQEQDFVTNLVNAVPIAVLFLDTNGNVLQVNSYLEQLTGYSSNELIGKEWFTILLPVENQVHTHDLFKNASFKMPAKTFMNPINTRCGKQLEIEWNGNVMHDVNGDISGLLIVGEDITERRQTENMLREGEEAFHAIVETSKDWIWSMDLNGYHTYCNPAVEGILGYSVDELVGRCCLDFMHEEDGHASEEMLRKKSNKQGWSNIILRWCHKDGTYRYLESNAVAVTNNKGELTGYRGVDRDITYRIQCNEKIAASNEILRNLIARMDNIREEERTSISREIHDEFGQALTILKISIGVFKQKLSNRDKELLNKIEVMLSIVDSCMEIARNIASNLRPTVLNELGLEAGISWYCKDIEKKTGVRYKLSGSVPEDLPDKIKNSLFRIFQEAVTNIIRHSHSDRFEVELKSSENYVYMVIRDFGIGLKEGNKINSDDLGILGMIERAHQYGGDVVIENHAQGGVQVMVNMPVVEPKQEAGQDDKSIYCR